MILRLARSGEPSGTGRKPKPKARTRLGPPLCPCPCGLCLPWRQEQLVVQPSLRHVCQATASSRLVPRSSVLSCAGDVLSQIRAKHSYFSPHRLCITLALTQ